MKGWMGLICLLAYAWMTYRALAGYTLEPRETLALSVIMIQAAVQLLVAWAKELRKESHE